MVIDDDATAPPPRHYAHYAHLTHTAPDARWNARLARHATPLPTLLRTPGDYTVMYSCLACTACVLLPLGAAACHMLLPCTHCTLPILDDSFLCLYPIPQILFLSCLVLVHCLPCPSHCALYLLPGWSTTTCYIYLYLTLPYVFLCLPTTLHTHPHHACHFIYPTTFCVFSHFPLYLLPVCHTFAPTPSLQLSSYLPFFFYF